jgi:hypothetical protein
MTVPAPGVLEIEGGRTSAINVQLEITGPFADSPRRITYTSVGTVASFTLSKGDTITFTALYDSYGLYFLSTSSTFNSLPFVFAEPVTVISEPDLINNTLTVSGGDWRQVSVVTGPFKSGAGTVQATTNNAIVLREDNEQWIDGFYVTVPEQRVARRLVSEVSMDIHKTRQTRD